MQDFPPLSASGGCILTGCGYRFSIFAIIVVIITAWAIPAVFRDEIESLVCPDDSQLRGYSHTKNGITTPGHACYDDDGKTRDLGPRLVIPLLVVTTIGVLAVIILINVNSPSSTQPQRISVLQALAGLIGQSDNSHNPDNDLD